MFDKLKKHIVNSRFIERYYNKYHDNNFTTIEYRTLKNIDINNKNILIVYPNNFLKNNAGNNSYVFQIVSTLKELGYTIDLFATEPIKNDFSNFTELNETHKLIRNLYIFRTDTKKQDKKYSSLSWCSDNILQEFQEIIKKNNYRCINVHYIHLMDLIKYSNVPENTKVIHTIHDFISLQYFYGDHNLSALGNNISKEIELLNYCDAITCISYDELGFFKRFYPDKEFYFLPHFEQRKFLQQKEKDIDCLFIGYSNTHNKNSVIWFMDNVYPHLSQNINITICGKVVEMIKKENPVYYKKMIDLEFNLIDFAEDLDELYSRTKISIVPMLSGTGLKIKTISAMSYGIPVVATTLGVDGFIDKLENGCLVNDNPALFAQNINNLLADENYYLEIQNKQNMYFNKYFSKEKTKLILKGIFDE